MLTRGKLCRVSLRGLEGLCVCVCMCVWYFFLAWSMMTEFCAEGMADCSRSTKSSIGSCGTRPYFTPPKSSAALYTNTNIALYTNTNTNIALYTRKHKQAKTNTSIGHPVFFLFLFFCLRFCVCVCVFVRVPVRMRAYFDVFIVIYLFGGGGGGGDVLRKKGRQYYRGRDPLLHTKDEATSYNIQYTVYSIQYRVKGKATRCETAVAINRRDRDTPRVKGFATLVYSYINNVLIIY